jgi:fatty-acyl-CoA synthase
MNRVLRLARAGAVLARTNIVPFERPDRLPRAALAAAPWGTTVGALVAAAAARYPDRVAVHDDGGSTTYRTMWDRARRIGAALADRNVGPGTRVGLLARNHVGFVEWLVGAAITGADVVLLNTGSAGPQLADVVAHEQIAVLVHDDDSADIVAGCLDAGCAVEIVDESEARRMARHGRFLAPRRQQGRIVIMTSGTTGRPKGTARRSDIGSIEAAAAVLERIPLRFGDTQVVAAPLFHAWGFTNLLFGLNRCATTVLTPRFDAAATLQALVDHRARVLVVVPVMLTRMIDVLDAEANDARSPASATVPAPDLEVIASSGSALGGRLARDVLDRFGPVLYNLYGSTEVAVATIATPDDLALRPTTAGRVVSGVRVVIVDDDGRAVPAGQPGRVFVGGPVRFEGYTGGGGKEELDGMLSSGDVGRFEDGLLFIEGRDDDMIVSGGENVFPGEVEELLGHHPAILDAAVVGMPDDEFGHVLAAWVVARGDAVLTAADVRDYVKANLARHKVPRRVELVAELPRNESGKLLRRALADGAPRSRLTGLLSGAEGGRATTVRVLPRRRSHPPR